MDIETVITHLQIIHTWAEFARERDLQFFTEKHLEDIAQWADDALNLLKEQKAAYQGAEELLRQKTILFDDAIKRLNEQEAVEPKTGHWIWLQFCANEGVYCSECHTKMFDRYPMKKKLSQFCGHCGAKMKQEGR